jgi:hypothetical protein
MFLDFRYVSEDANGMVVDRSHPMYSVAAVIAACKYGLIINLLIAVTVQQF